MIYINRVSEKIVILLSVAVLATVGCSRTPVTQTASPTLPGDLSVAREPSTASSRTLLPTESFIPKVKRNKKGEKEPYQASLSPYILQKVSVAKPSVALFIVARRAYKSGAFEQAKVVLERLLQQDSTLSGPWVMLGDIELKNDNPDHNVAEKHFLQAIAVNSVNTNAYLRLAYVQRLQGRFIASQNTYANLLALWKDFPEAHLNLGVLYDVYLNDAENAQRHFEAYQFLTNNENVEAAAWLREVQQRTGLPPELRWERAH